MSSFIETLDRGTLLADGATGSYLFERTGRLSEANHLYEALNRDRPDLIREVHFSYLQAGARCLTTNTFSANRTLLATVGEEDQVKSLNQAGVEAARQALTAFRNQHQEEGPFYILGSVGPTREGHESPQELKEIYREQFGALITAGVDALQLETFTSLAQVMVLLDLLEEYPERPPVILQMSLQQTGHDGGWSQDPIVLVKTAADMGAQVVGVNCCSPWEATAFLDAVANEPVVKDRQIRLALSPNGGGFNRIGHRFMTNVNPEFMGKLGRTFASRGVGLVGGCCEVHPPHIAEMHNYLNSIQGPRRAIELVSFEAQTPAGPDLKSSNGPFSAKLFSGQFAVSVEMLPPRNTRPRLLQGQVDFVAELAATGLADALDITDGSRGIPLMPPGDFAAVVRERLDWDQDQLEFIPHFTTRDLNAMGLQSRLVGYYARHIHNVLVITGDPPKMSPTYPRSTAVFDMDSATLIHYVNRCLNSGVDFGGRSLGKQQEPRTHFTIGSGFEPEAVDLEAEKTKLQLKIDGGADYIMTQPAFRFGPLDSLRPFRDRVKVLIGVLVLTSLEHARRFDQVPGVSVPEEVFGRLARYDNPADQAKAGVEFAAEQIRWIKANDWAGLYLMSPASHRPLLDVLRQGLE
jgi:methionine synthase / methylenetetrahydrofolate reductase(NADPH)